MSTYNGIGDTILSAIGHTPMIRINHLTKGIIDADVVAKIETFNPGNSIKDRMALKMIEDAERAGLLKPGGTFVRLKKLAPQATMTPLSLNARLE